MIVDQSALPLVLIAPDGTMMYASGTVSRVLGWPAEQLVGHNMAEYLAPDQVELALEVIAEIEQVDRGGAGVPMVFAIRRDEHERQRALVDDHRQRLDGELPGSCGSRPVRPPEAHVRRRIGIRRRRRCGAHCPRF